ncbi:MAG: hypothetical protein IKU38_08310 [Clostridia bacterium]|nr:hypothetical protein [Clostridia bacterium]
MAFLISQEIDLARANPVLRYEQPMESDDACAHVWCVAIVKDKEVVDLKGMSAKCFIKRAANAQEKARGVSTVTVIQDAQVDRDMGMVCCCLDKGCYAGVGALTGVMRVYGAAGSVVAVAKMTAVLERNTSDAVYDPEGLVPSMDALLAQIATIEAATKAANDAAAAANAAAQSANFVVIGHYDTLAQLQTAHPTGNRGDAWAIGTAEPYAVYIWDVDAKAWKSIGQLQGAQGAQGPTGAAGRGVSSVILTGGDHSPGTMDTYTMYFTDGMSVSFMVYNGADGKDGETGDAGLSANQELNTTSDVTFKSVTADVVYGAVFME